MNNYSVLISDPAWIIIAGEDLHVICYVVHITVLQINEYIIICDQIFLKGLVLTDFQVQLVIPFNGYSNRLTVHACTIASC